MGDISRATTRGKLGSRSLLTFKSVFRIPVLAVAVRSSAGVHVRHDKAHLLLCVPSQERGKSHYTTDPTYLSNPALERGCQIRLSLEERPEEPQVQQVLVPSQGRRPLLLRRHYKRLLPQRPDRPALRHISRHHGQGQGGHQPLRLYPPPHIPPPRR